MNIDVTCKSCKIQKYCPESGSTPLRYNLHLIPCQISGGYGRYEIPKSKVGIKSLPLYEKNGKCVSFALIPYIDEVGNLATKLVKVFHPPIKHPRESTDYDLRNKFDPNKNY